MWYFLFEHPLLFLSFNSLTSFCPSQYNRGRRTWRSPLRLQWGWTESLGSDSGCQRHDLVLASRVQLSFARKFSSLCRESFFTDAVWRKGFSKVCLLLILSELLCLFLYALHFLVRDGSFWAVIFPVDICFFERRRQMCVCVHASVTFNFFASFLSLPTCLWGTPLLLEED